MARPGVPGIAVIARSIARRAIPPVATIGAAFLLVFFLLRLLPGDPADRLDAPGILPEQAERARNALGLGEPLRVQLGRTIAAWGRGDLGISMSRHRPVVDVIAEALPATAALSAAALLLAYGLGTATAVGGLLLPPRGRKLARAAMIAASAAPTFWVAVLLVLVLHAWAGWLPASHASSPDGVGIADRLAHLVLPALALGLPAAATVARYQMASAERMLDAPHVRSARARGGGWLRVLATHVVRPSLTPTLALLGLDLPVLISGALVVETAFAWPGLGRITAQAVLASDYPLALAVSVLAATSVVGGRLVSEALAKWIDPRLEDPAAETAK